MKIAISTAVYYPQINGVAVFSHNLASGLAARGHEVIVICPSQTGKPHTKTIDGVKVYYLKSRQLKLYPDQIHDASSGKRLFYKHGFQVSLFPGKEVDEVLAKFSPDVVHIQVSDPVGLAVSAWARKHKVPVVMTEHNQPEVLTDPIHVPKIMKKPINKALSSYFRSRQRKSDFATMPTKQAIDNLSFNTGKRLEVPIAAVSNGVDLKRFKPGKVSPKIYTKYGLADDMPTVLYVGRVDPEKKVGVVIEAFLRVLEKVPDARLLIVGDGVDKARLERKYGIINNIRFLGRISGDDLYELYKTGWVFATASEIETQGIVLIEAAASGLPLVAVDKGAVAEVCIDEENGYLCEPGSVPEIANAITTILTDEKLRKDFAKKSLEVAKEHDFETTLDRFINIYNKVSKSESDNR